MNKTIVKRIDGCLSSFNLSVLNTLLLQGAVLTGLSASGNAYKQALSEGYSKDEANRYSLMVGASEATLGAIIGGINPLKGVTKTAIQNIAAGGITQAVFQLATSSVGAFAEEYTQELLEPVFRNIAFGKKRV